MSREEWLRERHPDAPSLRAKPEPLPLWLCHLPGAFFELSSCREFGMAVGPIPWTAIVEYAERMGACDEFGLEAFCRYIRDMDVAYLEYHNRAATKVGGKP